MTNVATDWSAVELRPIEAGDEARVNAWQNDRRSAT